VTFVAKNVKEPSDLATEYGARGNKDGLLWSGKSQGNSYFYPKVSEMSCLIVRIRVDNVVSENILGGFDTKGFIMHGLLKLV